MSDPKIESLYNGDMRLDNHLNQLEDMILEYCGGKQVPMLSLIGVLDRVKYRLQRELDD